MKSLTIDTAIALARKNFDEQAGNESDMIEDVDSEELDSVLAKTLPEAINDIHSMAPVQMLDGLEITKYNGLSADGLTLKIEPQVSDWLRLVAFKSEDSNYVISDAVPEYSAEGRMQLNPYTKGTYDRPRLVQKQGTTLTPVLKYYSLESVPAGTDIVEVKDGDDVYYTTDLFSLYYLPRYEYDEDTESYQVCDQLQTNIIDRLCGLVCAIYNDARAQYFIQKAIFGAPAQESK